MRFKLTFTPEASEKYTELENEKSQIAELKAVRKCLGFIETNPRHPSLQTKRYHGNKGPCNERVFESYAEQHTPSAYRVFWYYGPERHEITIASIVPHPKK